MTDDDFNRRNIEEFRANHGRLGGQFDGAPVLLLHSKGARSGKERVNPMMYMADGDRYLVFASAAGADHNPAWYWNLVAHPDACTRSTHFRPSATRASPNTSAKPSARFPSWRSSPKRRPHENRRRRPACRVR